MAQNIDYLSGEGMSACAHIDWCHVHLCANRYFDVHDLAIQDASHKRRHLYICPQQIA